MKNVQSMPHRRHYVRSGEHNGSWQARATRGRKSVGPITSGATREEAVQAVISYLDQEAALENNTRSKTGVPSPAAYRAAFDAIGPLQRYEDDMLTAHLAAPGYVLTATELAAAAGYDNYQGANRWYGELARKIAEELEWSPAKRPDGTPMWTTALATDANEAGDEHELESGHFRWRLRPEVVEALGLSSLSTTGKV